MTWVLVNFALNIYVTLHGLIIMAEKGEHINNDDKNGKESSAEILRHENRYYLFDRNGKIIICGFCLLLFISCMIPVFQLWVFNCQRKCERNKERAMPDSRLHQQTIIVDEI